MSKLKIEYKSNALEQVGVQIKDVEYGVTVLRSGVEPKPTVYLVVSPMDGSGDKALVMLGGGTFKRVDQSTRVFPVEAQLSIGAEQVFEFKFPDPVMVGIDLADVELRVAAAMNVEGTRTGRFTATRAPEDRRQRNYISHLERKCDELEARAESAERAEQAALQYATESEYKIAELDKLGDAQADWLEWQRQRLITLNAEYNTLKVGLRGLFSELAVMLTWNWDGNTLGKIITKLREFRAAFKLNDKTYV